VLFRDKLIHSILVKKIFLIIPIIFFIIDRLIKYFAPSINLEGGFVNIALYKNFAGAFSLPITGLVYNILGIVLIFIFIYLYILSFSKNKNIQLVAYLFIIMGGASNVFDRISFGYVIDYVQVLGRSFFNIADVMLIVGVGILIIKQFNFKRNKIEI